MAHESATDKSETSEGIGESLRWLKVSYLQTFLKLCKKETVQEVAGKGDGRQTLVTKQIKAINRYVGKLAGQDLVTLTKKSGGRIKITKAGRLFQPYAQKILDELRFATHAFQKEHEKFTIRVGLTRIMPQKPFVREILKEIKQAFRKRDHEIEIVYVKLGDVPAALDKGVDFLFAGIIPNQQQIPDEIEFVKFEEEQIVLLANFRVERERTAKQQLSKQKHHLVAPPSGGWTESVLVNTMGKENLDKTVGLWSDDVLFSLDLVRLELRPQASIVVVESTAQIAKEQEGSSPHLNTVPLQGLRVEYGFLRRKEDASIHDPTHPFRALQNVVEKHHRSMVARSPKR
jgi:DNA-binding transcriptional LysR family regulator